MSAKRVIREDAPVFDFLENVTKTEKPNTTKATTQQPAKEIIKKTPGTAETKSQRVQLVLKPSLVKKIKEEAWREHKSLNEYISQVLEDKIGGKK